MRRLLSSLTWIVLLVLVVAAPAAAQNPIYSGTAGPGGATAGAGNGGSSPASPLSAGGGRGGGSGGSSCIYAPVYPNEYGPYFDPNADNAITGQWYDTVCDGVFSGTPIFVPAKIVVRPTPVQPTQLAQRALSTAPFAPLMVTLSPPADHEAVNFPIFLDVASGYSRVTATASAGGVTSTVTITPISVTWSMGDGHDVTCTSAGSTYNPGQPFSSQLSSNGLPTCGYKYALSSADQPGAVFRATVTVHYTATWTVAGAPGGGNLGPIDRSAYVNMTVGEIQTLNS